MTTNDYSAMSGLGLFFGFTTVMMLFTVAMVVLVCIIYWRMLEKAGRPGWYGIIPILNLVELSDIATGYKWYWLLSFIPIVGWIASLLLNYKLYKSFGISTEIAIISLIVPIAPFMIAFSNEVKYCGPASSIIEGNSII